MGRSFLLSRDWQVQMEVELLSYYYCCGRKDWMSQSLICGGIGQWRKGTYKIRFMGAWATVVRDV